MKKKLLILTSCVFVFAMLFVLNNKEEKELSNNESIVTLHKKNIENSPFKETMLLTKKERKAQGLPPNKFYEQEWELTMNPVLGRPTFENLKQIRADQKIKRNAYLAARVPGEIDNAWIERGPNNVGGRTRAIMFDPNDGSNETMFAGGVSGGLWKNTNISNPNSTWTRVDIPENLAVSSITFDPNDPTIFYVGTGESYVNGDVNGDGVWKSEDAGTTWAKVFGGITGGTYFGPSANMTVNSPAGIAGDYLSFPTTAFGQELTATVTGNVVLIESTIVSAQGQMSTSEQGCGDVLNAAAINGNIALIRRGSCNFTIKVKSAQDAGAIAVVVMNDDRPLIPMGGDDATVTIPSVMISQSDGDLIQATLLTGSVSVSLNPSEFTFDGLLVPGIQFVNDIRVRDNGGVSEVYVAAGDSFYGASNTATNLTGPEYGLYKSVDNGVNWTEVALPLTGNGNKYCPNDIEIGSDNNLWVSTINSSVYGDGGGTIFRSADGVNFNLERSVPGANRTQIAISSTDPEKLYVLAQGSNANPVLLEKTQDGFATTTAINVPNDADTGIPDNDFTRGQAFYDLMLEVDPNNDQTVYAGGIDLFSTTNGAATWNQISKWSNNNNLASLNVPLVHADQHAMTFASGSSSIVAFGNDGGVYYSNDGGDNIGSRNNDYNTSQFYTVGVGPTTAFTGDYFAGGLQDNGTQLFVNAPTDQASSSIEAFGGDGAYTFFDQDGTDRYFIRNFVFNRAINLFNLDTNTSVTINSNDGFDGAFINPQGLDSSLDILYSNYSSGGNSIIRRYSGIKSAGTLQAENLTNAMMDSSPTAFNVSPYTTTSTTLLVGTVLGDIFKIENADTAPTWTELDVANNNIVGSISDVEFGADEDEIFVTLHNYGVQNIWYTNDGGVNWQAKEGDLPDMPVKAILQNPLNLEEVIIGTELGVWFTDNFSAVSPNWNQAFNGMSNVKVLDLDMRDDFQVFAATYGRGVFSGTFDAIDPNGDEDGDLVLNGVDNCIFVANPDQADVDGNGIGDACQDTDEDGVLDINDNCPTVANPDQADADGNNVGDACEDADGDGVFDDVDNCIDTPNPDQADTNGNGFGDACDTSYENPDNITLEITSETCEDQDNGKVVVNVNETFVDYTLTVVGNGINLSEQLTSNTFTFEDLAVGFYTVCVAVNGTTYEQCFEINIEAAEVIELELVNPGNGSNTRSVNVSSGTAPYTVLFKNEVIKITSNPIFDLEIIGSGELEIKTAKACEGTFKRTIVNQLDIIASPNPVINDLKITLPTALTQNQILVEVYDVTGKLVVNQNYSRLNTNFIQVPFGSLNAGIYFVKLNLETPKVLKIIKK